MKRHCSLKYSGNIPALHLLPATSDWPLKSSSCVWNCCCFCCPLFDKVSMTGEPFFVPFYRHLQLLMSLEPDNILRNIYGVLTGFSCTFIEEIKIFISYTLWRQGNFSCRSRNFSCYPLVGRLEMGIQIRMAKKALIQNVADGLWMLAEGTDRKFLEEGALGFILCILLFFCWKC